MGSWSGHVLPGSFFIVMGIIWAIKASFRFFFTNSTRTNRRICSRCQWDMMEAIGKIIMSSFGLIIEQVLPWEPWFHLTNDDGHYQNMNNWSHSTMYAFFLISGICDILVIKFPKSMPHCVHHIALGLAFAVEGYLFYFHTHGREELDVRFHVLLLFAIWPTSLVLLWLAIVDNNENMSTGYALLSPKSHLNYASVGNSDGSPLLYDDTDLTEGTTMNEDSHLENGRKRTKLTESTDWTEMQDSNKNQILVTKDEEIISKRKKILSLHTLVAMLTIVHGCWFWQIAYTLYPPSGIQWDKTLHGNISFITMFFTWYILLAIIIVGSIFCAIALGTRLLKRSKRQNSYTQLQTRETV